MPDSQRAEQPDADDWAARLRARIAVERHRARAASNGLRGTATEGAEGHDAAFLSLRHAAQFAEIGTSVPSFERLGRVRRALARLTARILLYFLNLITLDQSRFNGLILRNLYALVDEQRRQAAGLQACVISVEHLRAEYDARLGEARTFRAAHEGSGSLREQLAAREGRVAASQDSAVMSGEQIPSPYAGPHVIALAFANTFRGDEARMVERQRHYVPHFEDCREVLDIGCGRGEFLELLRGAGIRSRGVDSDPEMVRRCREKDLDAIHAEALAYLDTLPDASLDGIFSAQVIEHMHAWQMITLVQSAHRTLRPDGLLLIETLNPESLLVHYRWFWMDLTHVRLVHPETLKFLLCRSGFHDVQCHFAPAAEGPPHIPPLHITEPPRPELERFNEATQYLNTLLYGSFDYAVIGNRCP